MRPHVCGSSTTCPGKNGWLSQPIGPLSGRRRTVLAETACGSAPTRVSRRVVERVPSIDVRRRRRDGDRHEAVRIETERRAIEATHRAIEERRPGQQRQCHGNLRDDQRALGAPATRMRELATVREGAGDVNLTSRQCRPERTEPTRDERHRSGEDEDAAVSQAHGVEPRHVARGKPDQAAFDGVRDDEGARQRDGRRDHALDQDLGGQPADRCTEAAGRPAPSAPAVHASRAGPPR